MYNKIGYMLILILKRQIKKYITYIHKIYMMF